MSTTSNKERARLAALRSYQVLDTPAERVFDSIVRLAASIAGTPTALISFVDGQRQWFKAKVGMDAPETPRDISFCTHAIETEEVLVVPDATKDARFAANPLVTDTPGIRFYAGAPLITLEGQALGTLCVIDYVPRNFTAEEEQALRDLSQFVMAQLEIRRRLAQFTRGDRARQETIATITDAIENNELCLHYQPTFDLRTRRIDRLEAFIRWQSPQRGLIEAAQLLPILESSGLIIEIGRWVLEQAARDYRRWLAQNLHVPRVSVNLSTLQLQHPDIVPMLGQVSRPNGATPMFMDVEIKEATLVGSTPEMIARLYEIQQKGIGVIVDDLGSTPAGLQDLARAPVDAVKLDSSLATSITSSPDSMQRVADLITRAHGHGLQVIAKGVETPEQRRLLDSLSCDQIQGSLVAMPTPAADIGLQLGLLAQE